MCDHSQCPCQIKRKERERREAEHRLWLERKQEEDKKEFICWCVYLLVFCIFSLPAHLYPEVKVFGMIAGALSLPILCLCLSRCGS